MATVTITKCDQCGATKGVDNHWLILSYAPEVTTMWRVHEAGSYEGKGFNIFDLCSTECLKLKLNELRKPKILQDPETKAGEPMTQFYDPSVIQRVLSGGVQVAVPKPPLGERKYSCYHCGTLVANPQVWDGLYVCNECAKGMEI